MADPPIASTSESLPLVAPDSFSFPYPTPYAIQRDLMQTVFAAIEQSKIAIVQSPTGTVRPSRAR